MAFLLLQSEVLFTLVIGILLYAFVQPFKNSVSRVPGPWYSRWTGMVLKYKWLTGQRPSYVHKLHQKYGPVVRIGPNEVDVTDMEAIQAIYSTNETFKKSSFYTRLTAVRTPVLFTITDVNIHRRLRRLMGTPISASSLRSHASLIQSRIDLYIDRIKREMSSRGAADIFKWSLYLATDVVGELSFGESFKTLEHGKTNAYVHMIESIGPLGAIRSAFPLLTSLAFYLPLPVLKSVANASKEIRRYGEESLRRFYNLATSETPVSNHMLFNKLQQAHQDGKITFEEICANAGGYILAGSDTTASTLTYLIWSLCRQPSVKDELVKQLGTLPPDFDDRDLQKLAYLGYVIDETLRLHTAAPSGLVRETPADGATIAGFQLDAGTIVGAQSYSMHRDPFIFVYPDVFNPERWKTPSKAMLDAFMPFGRGPRICIGIHLARMELRMTIASFFLAFPNVTLSTKEGFSDMDMEKKMFFVSNPVGRRCLVEV